MLVQFEIHNPHDPSSFAKYVCINPRYVVTVSQGPRDGTCVIDVDHTYNDGNGIVGESWHVKGNIGDVFKNLNYAENQTL